MRWERASATVVVERLVIVACGADDVTESSEFVSLQAENDLLAGNLDQATTDLNRRASTPPWPNDGSENATTSWPTHDRNSPIPSSRS
jgi:hypothetical protein